MRLFEVTDSNIDQTKLAALGQFLLGRAGDTGAKKTISIDAFIGLARDMGIALTDKQLRDLASQEPLSNLLEPLEPNSGVVRFKGNTETTTGMTVDQAQDVVDKNAKAAMKRDMK